MNKLHKLWRGKRTDTLEWAKFDVTEAVKVDLDTPGQCVGFTDRNRKPIFEHGNSIYFFPAKSTESRTSGLREALNRIRFLLKRPYLA